jgi:hypothetical protein
MKNSRLLSVFIIVLAIVLLVVFWLINSDNSFRWDETYRFQDEQPYDLKLVHKHLISELGDDNFDVLTKGLKEEVLPLQGAYVFIGAQAYYEEYETKTLVDWVAKGNTAFFAVKSLDPSIIASFFDTLTCPPILQGNTAYLYDTLVNVSLLHPALSKLQGEFKYIGKEGPDRYDFGCFDGRIFCNNSVYQPIGLSNKQYVNYIRIPHGKGQILVHCSPIMFTNYYMTSRSEAAYIQGVLSHINADEILWDEYHRYPHQEYNFEGSEQGTTPLEFVLENRSLRWAFYLILSLALIYLIAATRRQQRIIKLIEPLRNSTLEFVQAIGRLYFLQRNHPKLIQLQMRYFLHFIRERYRVKARTPDLIQLDVLSQRSSVSKEQIMAIIDEYERLKSYVKLSDEEAINFYKLLNKFYKTCH